MKKILAIMFALILVTSISTRKTDKRLKGIEKEFEKVLETFHAPGFAVAVVEKDRVVYSGGFGFRDYGNRIPVDENTLFAIGSCTKAFTTSLIGMLENEDKLSIDDSSLAYIPGFRFSTDEMNRSIIRDLEGYSVQFVEGESKKITELKFIQPNGIFTAKKKPPRPLSSPRSLGFRLRAPLLKFFEFKEGKILIIIPTTFSSSLEEEYPDRATRAELVEASYRQGVVVDL